VGAISDVGMLATTIAVVLGDASAKWDAVAAGTVTAVVSNVAWANRRWKEKHGIDRKIEQTTRTMLGYAIRHELDALADTIQSVGNGRPQFRLDLTLPIGPISASSR
jgi:hypothetical protein